MVISCGYHVNVPGLDIKSLSLISGCLSVANIRGCFHDMRMGFIITLLQRNPPAFQNKSAPLSNINGGENNPIKKKTAPSACSVYIRSAVGLRLYTISGQSAFIYDQRSVCVYTISGQSALMRSAVSLRLYTISGQSALIRSAVSLRLYIRSAVSLRRPPSSSYCFTLTMRGRPATHPLPAGRSDASWE